MYGWILFHIDSHGYNLSHTWRHKHVVSQRLHVLLNLWHGSKTSMMLLICSPDVQERLGDKLNSGHQVIILLLINTHQSVSCRCTLLALCSSGGIPLIWDNLPFSLFPSILHWDMPYDLFCTLIFCYLNEGNPSMLTVSGHMAGDTWYRCKDVGNYHSVCLVSVCKSCFNILLSIIVLFPELQV